MSFEQRLDKLETLAQKMEQGVAPLEELLQDYEAGMKLSHGLEAELEQARARMMEVKKGKGDTVEMTPSEVAKQGSLLDELEGEN